MARIISKVDPQTGRRRTIARVEGDTVRDRAVSLGNAVGITPGKASRLSNTQAGNLLAPGFSSFTPGPITSSNLTPTSAITVPSPTTTSSAPGLQGMIETQTKQFDDQFTKDLADQKAQNQQKTTSSLESLLTQMTQAKGEAALTDQAYKTQGVDETKTQLKDINNQILREQEALRKQTEAIQTRPGTATASERQREINQVERESLRKQADLSIIQLARQGQYDSAKEVADRAVALQLEEQKQKLDTYEFIYKENKDLFSESDKRLFETLQAERKMKLDNEEFRLRADYEQKIRVNDPKYQAELAKARYDLANPGGGADYVKLGSPERQNLLGVGYTTSEILNLESGINELGFNQVYEDEKAGGATPDQLKTLRASFGVPEKVTRDTINATVTQKTAYDELKKTYTEDELKALANKNKKSSFFTNKTADIERFLNSVEAKNTYVDLLHAQYKAAGMTED